MVGEILVKLPEDIVFWEILSKLPVKSLIKFKCVSKGWHKHIAGDVKFIEAHRRHHHRPLYGCGSHSRIAILRSVYGDSGKQYRMSLFAGEENHKNGLLPSVEEELEISCLMSKQIRPNRVLISVVGSSNGLVLVYKWYRTSSTDEYILWNPATREFRTLPESFGEDSAQIVHLGFDEETRDHKVLRLFKTVDRHYAAPEDPPLKYWVNIQVYSKNSDSWKSETITAPGFALTGSTVGVSVNGQFYFLARRPGDADVILSFRYGSEEVESPIDLPPYYGSCGYRKYELSSWNNGGSLALMVHEYRYGNMAEFWVMVEDDNNKGFYWSKLFYFNCPDRICAIWRDQFIVVPKMSDGRIEIWLWDPVLYGPIGALNLKKPDDYCCFYQVINYVPTLVSVYPELKN